MNFLKVVLCGALLLHSSDVLYAAEGGGKKESKKPTKTLAERRRGTAVPPVTVPPAQTRTQPAPRPAAYQPSRGMLRPPAPGQEFIPQARRRSDHRPTAAQPLAHRPPFDPSAHYSNGVGYYQPPVYPSGASAMIFDPQTGQWCCVPQQFPYMQPPYGHPPAGQAFMPHFAPSAQLYAPAQQLAPPAPQAADAHETLFSAARLLRQLDETQGMADPEELTAVLPDQPVTVDLLRGLRANTPSLFSCARTCHRKGTPLIFVCAQRNRDMYRGPNPTVLCLPGHFIPDGTFESVHFYSCSVNEDTKTAEDVQITKITDFVFEHFYPRETRTAADFGAACQVLCLLNNGAPEQVQVWKTHYEAQKQANRYPLQALLRNADKKREEAEAAEKAQREEEERLAAEAAARAQREKEEQERKLALQKQEAERLALQRQEDKRKAREAEEKRKKEEAERLAAEAAQAQREKEEAERRAREEEEKKAHEAAARAQQAEREKEEKQKLEEQRLALQRQEDERRATEAAEEKRKEQRRLAKRARQEEEKRKKQEAEDAARIAKRIAEKQKEAEQRRREQEALEEQRRIEAVQEQRKKEQQSALKEESRKQKQQEEVARQKAAAAEKRRKEQEEKRLLEEAVKAGEIARATAKAAAPTFEMVQNAYRDPKKPATAQQILEKHTKFYALEPSQAFVLGVQAFLNTETFSQRDGLCKQWEEQALAHFKACINKKDTPEAPLAWLHCGKIHLARGNFKDAGAFFQSSNTPEARRLLADLCTKKEFTPKGIAFATCDSKEKKGKRRDCPHRYALKLLELNVDAESLVARAHLLMNRRELCFEQAEIATMLDCFRTAAQLGDVEGYIGLAVQEKLHGNTRAAINSLKMGIQLEKGSTHGEKALESVLQLTAFDPGEGCEDFILFLEEWASIVEQKKMTVEAQKKLNNVILGDPNKSNSRTVLSESVLGIAGKNLEERALRLPLSELNIVCTRIEGVLNYVAKNHPFLSIHLQKIGSWRQAKKAMKNLAAKFVGDSLEKLLREVEEKFERKEYEEALQILKELCEEFSAEDVQTNPTLQRIFASQNETLKANPGAFTPVTPTSSPVRAFINPQLVLPVCAARHTRDLPLLLGPLQPEEIKEMFMAYCPNMPPEERETLITRVIEHLERVAHLTEEERSVLPALLQMYVLASEGKVIEANTLGLATDFGNSPACLRLFGHNLLRSLVSLKDEGDIPPDLKHFCHQTLITAHQKGDKFAEVLLSTQKLLGLGTQLTCGEPREECSHDQMIRTCKTFIKNCPCEKTAALLCHKCKATHELLAIIYSEYPCEKRAVDNARAIAHLDLGGAPHMLLRSLLMQLETTPGAEKSIRAAMQAIIEGQRTLDPRDKRLCGLTNFLALSIATFNSLTLQTVAGVIIPTIRAACGPFYTPGEGINETPLRAVLAKLPQIIALLKREICIIHTLNQTTLRDIQLSDALQTVELCALELMEFFPSLELPLMCDLAKVNCHALQIRLLKTENPDEKAELLKLFLIKVAHLINLSTRKTRCDRGMDYNSLTEALELYTSCCKVIGEPFIKEVQGTVSHECLHLINTIRTGLLEIIQPIVRGLIDRCIAKGADNCPIIPRLLTHYFEMAANTHNHAVWDYLHTQLERILQYNNQVLPPPLNDFSNASVALALRRIILMATRETPLAEKGQGTARILEDYLKARTANECAVIKPLCGCAGETDSDCYNGVLVNELLALLQGTKTLLHLQGNPKMCTDGFEQDLLRQIITQVLTVVQSADDRRPRFRFSYFMTTLTETMNELHSTEQFLPALKVCCNFLKLTVNACCSGTPLKEPSSYQLIEQMAADLHTLIMGSQSPMNEKLIATTILAETLESLLKCLTSSTDSPLSYKKITIKNHSEAMLQTLENINHLLATIHSFRDILRNLVSSPELSVKIMQNPPS